ncbi:RluA family pseudouridine synthase [Bacteroides fragilis]|jgi:pseudouridylate synthase|uniref:RluA family pseudouridine synthase n=1 Tax=Bacteroides fragilis TaxID=817 RepID=UPI0015F422CC|nr:RluA family pseudouridine synthase [Bacteroides fragilis]MBA5649557.1 RNA pseudouridine synthase [Bacteroides fragilis]MCE9400025.1 RNA pseudouridine synthase [Bacteroides fragilis]MCE9470355.1 RNA pseudouridine synthase [Bacteroides fragilis]MCZ2502356.1 pseudouridine synthase [Bacteroides fragilis]
MFHSFQTSIAGIELPHLFTYPFHYTPHPLCVMAAGEVQAYINKQTRWKEELDKGKMFGVLIVRTSNGQTGYLAAFSGNLCGSNSHSFFVPPVYDLLKPDGFFKIEEEQISAINHQIGQLQNCDRYLELQQKMERETASSQQALSEARKVLKAAKEKREQRRLHRPNENEQAAMIRESQYQKAEFKRLERYWKEQISEIKTEMESFSSQIEALKAERRNRSAALQQKLFQQFNFLNAKGETKNLCAIFEETVQKTPPAGAGECAAPKLLQYAYLSGLSPIAMAEFWWGESPKTEIRHHGYYYPSCRGKCEPILRHMLQGLDVEPAPSERYSLSQNMPEILFEDQWLLVLHKPEGVLSVPGKSEEQSIYSLLRARYPEATGPLVVHRLDMATSGLLLAAKTQEVHRHLQAQFENRSIKKRYIALLDGILSEEEGVIDLPICPDYLDRPRQMVNEELGKTAITRYRVMDRKNGQTRIAFFPLTGRTHQLRVHAAHPLGLNCPIVGDELYGRKAERLYLHAEYLEFIHPVSGQRMVIEKKAEF